MYFVELKTTGKKPTLLQQKAIGELRELGFAAYVNDVMQYPNQLTVYTGFALCLAAPYIDKHIGEEPEENEDPEESEKQEPHLIKEPNE